MLDHDAALELRARAGGLPRARDAGSEPPVVGRDAELARLREHWQAARRGAGRLVIVCGAEGSGKTRLAAELAGEVQRAGGAVEYVAARGSRGAAAAVLGALREARRPRLVVIDDADGVGDEFVSALGGPARVPARAGVLVVVCSRDRDALNGRATDETLVLAPLAAEAVRELGIEPRAELRELDHARARGRQRAASADDLCQNRTGRSSMRSRTISKPRAR